MGVGFISAQPRKNACQSLRGARFPDLRQKKIFRISYRLLSVLACVNNQFCIQSVARLSFFPLLTLWSTCVCLALGVKQRIIEASSFSYFLSSLLFLGKKIRFPRVVSPLQILIFHHERGIVAVFEQKKKDYRFTNLPLQLEIPIKNFLL